MRRASVEELSSRSSRTDSLPAGPYAPLKTSAEASGNIRSRCNPVMFGSRLYMVPPLLPPQVGIFWMTVHKVLELSIIREPRNIVADLPCRHEMNRERNRPLNHHVPPVIMPRPPAVLLLHDPFRGLVLLHDAVNVTNEPA